MSAASTPNAQQKQRVLYALSNAAEREGRMDAALALAKWADATAPYAAYTQEEIQRLAPRWARRRIGGGR